MNEVDKLTCSVMCAVMLYQQLQILLSVLCFCIVDRCSSYMVVSEHVVNKKARNHPGSALALLEALPLASAPHAGPCGVTPRDRNDERCRNDAV